MVLRGELLDDPEEEEENDEEKNVRCGARREEEEDGRGSIDANGASDQLARRGRFVRFSCVYLS